MADNIIEKVEGVINDSKALQQDAKQVLDDMGSSLFQNKVENLQLKVQKFIPIAAGHASKPEAPWYEEVPVAQLKSMPDLYRQFEKTLSKNEKLCGSIDIDIDEMIKDIDAVETLQGSLNSLITSMDLSSEYTGKAKEIKNRLIATRAEAHTILAWHGTATHSKDQRMKAIGIVHTWMCDKGGDTKMLLPKIRELLQESGEHKPGSATAKRQKFNF